MILSLALRSCRFLLSFCPSRLVLIRAFASKYVLNYFPCLFPLLLYYSPIFLSLSFRSISICVFLTRWGYSFWRLKNSMFFKVLFFVVCKNSSSQDMTVNNTSLSDEKGTGLARMRAVWVGEPCASLSCISFLFFPLFLVRTHTSHHTCIPFLFFVSTSLPSETSMASKGYRPATASLACENTS